MLMGHSRLTLGAVLGIAVSACSSATEPSSPDFTVRVDSISGPNAVSGGIAANAFLWGTVGPNGCTMLKELQTTRAPSQIDVTVIGKRVAGASCAAGSLSLSGAVLRLDPPITYDFMIVVHQPDGSTLTRRIYGE